MIDDARFEALRDRLGQLHGKSHALARQIGDVDLSTLRTPADLALIPVLRKSALAEMQRAEPPFGALAAAPTAMFRRLFASPGGVYEPESAGDDPWGAARAFAAAGVKPGEIVVNCFSYHLTPGRADSRERRAGAGLPGHPGRPRQHRGADRRDRASEAERLRRAARLLEDRARQGARARRRRVVAQDSARFRRGLAALVARANSKAQAFGRGRPTRPPTSARSPGKPTTRTEGFCPDFRSTTTSSSRS